MKLILDPSPGNSSVTIRTARMVVETARCVGSADGQARWVHPRRESFWQPIQLDWMPGPKPSRLRLQRQLGLGPEQDESRRPEDCMLDAGDRVILRHGATGQEWFRGVVARQEGKITPGAEGESLVAEAFGPEMLLDALLVSGSWYMTSQAFQREIDNLSTPEERTMEKVFASKLPAVFNPSGQPNASGSCWRLSDRAEGYRSRVFVSPGRIGPGSSLAAVHWDPCSAVRSLVEWLDGYRIVSPATRWDRIEAILGDSTLEEVNVDGLTLPEAIDAVLTPLGFGFAFEPWSTSGKHRLIVFDRSGRHEGRSPRLAPGNMAMSDPPARLAEVQELSFVRDARRIRNDVTVLGDQKRVQLRLEFNHDPLQRSLHPAWHPESPYLALLTSPVTGGISPRTWSQETLEEFVNRYHRDGADQATYRNALRSFTWNEDLAWNDLSTVEPPDPGSLSEHLVDQQGQWVVRPRKPGPAFQRGNVAPGRTLRPARATLSIEDCPEAQVAIPAQIWPESCGLSLDIDSFFRLNSTGVHGEFKPFASLAPGPLLIDGIDRGDQIRQADYLDLLHNTLAGTSGLRIKLHLDCSIETDTPVEGKVAFDADSPWPLPRRKQVRWPHRFAWRVLEGDPGDLEYELVDDTPAAQKAAEVLAKAGQSGYVQGRALLRYLSRTWKIGDHVDSTRGRDIDLTVPTSQGVCSPCVTGVQWLFGPDKTRLLLDCDSR